MYEVVDQDGKSVGKVHVDDIKPFHGRTASKENSEGEQAGASPSEISKERNASFTSHSANAEVPEQASFLWVVSSLFLIIFAPSPSLFLLDASLFYVFIPLVVPIFCMTQGARGGSSWRSGQQPASGGGACYG